MRPNTTIVATTACALFTTSLVAQDLSQTNRYVAADRESGDSFGASVDVSQNVVAVGASFDDVEGVATGSAYLFNASTGVQLHKLVADDSVADDEFGFSIAIDGDLVVVGAWRADPNGDRSGAAYVFDVATGAQIMKLLPDDGAASDGFGYDVAIDADLIAVSSIAAADPESAQTGAVYLFDRDTLMQSDKIQPDDLADGDQFGYSIALDDGVLAVGAPFVQDSARPSGAVYLFDTSDSHLLHRVPHPVGANGGQFGCAVAVDAGALLAGARSLDNPGIQVGAAFLVDIDSGDIVNELPLPDDIGANFANFGSSVALGAGIAAVGAPNNNADGSLSGSAYIFQVTTASQVATLVGVNTVPNNRFGWSIAMDASAVVVGAPEALVMSSTTGAAYLFDAPPAPCSLVDLADPLGTIDFSDVVAYLQAFSNMDPEADLADPVGTWDFSDVTAFLVLFSEGCP
ncbi:MAG: GC-type dockerin domain-anchored protein [Phycisphaerales bacterium]